MVHYFKFRQELLDPEPARDVYIKRPAGKGWPEECPPMRAANGFGFDLLANFDITFVRNRDGSFRVEPDLVIESDFEWSRTEDSPGVPLVQQYAWFWARGQTIPHVITDNVWKEVNNQVKVSSFLYLKTDPNELLWMGDVPNMNRPFRTLCGVVDTDWYPASYPWHIVLELSRNEKRIEISAGEPLCRVIPLRRDTYFARPMSEGEFGEFFERGQEWLSTHGQIKEEGVVDIQRSYVREQLRSKFIVRK